MKNYQLLAHTADVRLRVRASTLEELFSGALEGMNSIIKPGCPVAKNYDIEHVLVLSALDVTALLIDFLSEILTLSTIDKALFTHVTFQQLTPTDIRATISGKKVASFDEDIKAVTYHGAAVVHSADRMYEVVITFDI